MDDVDTKLSRRQKGRLTAGFSVPDLSTGSARPHESCRPFLEFLKCRIMHIRAG
jgi:hypothetical protein